MRTRWMFHGLCATALTLSGLAFNGSFAQDEAKSDKPAAEQPAGENKPAEEEGGLDLTGNPYLAADGASVEDLVKHLDKLESKPKTIQARPEFLQALTNTADRLLSSKIDDEAGERALMVLFESLYQLSRRGEGGSGELLMGLAKKHADDPRPAVANEAKLVLLQDRLENVDFEQAELLPPLMEETRTFFKAQKTLGERHLAAASAAVRLVNQLPSEAAAMESYRELGEVFAKSKTKKLADYGKSLVKLASKLELQLKPVEIAGTFLDGAPLDWSTYKDKVVLIDFWATWCGPCVAEVPNMKTQYEKYHAQGFEILGISLDEDLDAVRAFVDEKEIPWPTLIGHNDEEKAGKHPMVVKFGVRAIPTMILVGRDGKIISMSARGETLSTHLSKLFPADGSKPADSAPQIKPNAGPIP